MTKLFHLLAFRANSSDTRRMGIEVIVCIMLLWNQVNTAHKQEPVARAISSQFAVKSAISNTLEGNQNMNMSIDGLVKLTYKYTNLVPSEFPLTTKTTPCRNSLIETQGGHRTFIVLATTTFRSQIGSKLSCRRCRAGRIVECLNLLFDSMLIVSGIC